MWLNITLDICNHDLFGNQFGGISQIFEIPLKRDDLPICLSFHLLPAMINQCQPNVNDKMQYIRWQNVQK